MVATKVGNKWQLAKRRNWELTKLRFSLYYGVRRHRGVRREEMASIAGVTAAMWRYRELAKESYRLPELCALKELSGLEWQEFGKIIESCC